MSNILTDIGTRTGQEFKAHRLRIEALESIDPVTKDTDTGAAMIPAGTTAQRPTNPVNGYLRYNSDLLAMEAYTNGAWGSVGGGATGGSTDRIFSLNGTNVTTSYSIPSNQNAGSFGPITINDGITVTIPDGSTWTVV